VLGNEVVVTVGRLAAGTQQTVSINTTVSSGRGQSALVATFAIVSSSTAQPVFTNLVATSVRRF